MGEVEASIFLGNSLIGGGGMGEKSGPSLRRDGPEERSGLGAVPLRVDQGLLGMRRMTACLSSPENLKGIFWA
jgi:hypothetical protein